MPYKNLEITNASTVSQSVKKQSHFYKGFSSVNNKAFGNQLFDFDLVKQDIINHFNTRVGERVMKPEFGCIIWDLLMEPLTEEIQARLTQNIKYICTYDPRVTPTTINLTQTDGGYLVELELTLKNTDLSSFLSLQFDQNSGLTVQ